MSLLSLVLIGVGLSIDSLAASITIGACSNKIRTKHILKIALFMAVFQGVLPLLGWLLGSSFKHVIEAYDHWIAFFILLIIGSKLIFEGFTHKEACDTKINYTNNLVLAGMAIATSIDALIIGVGFGLVEIKIGLAMLVIGSTTFIFSVVGVLIGRKIGTKINRGIEVFGGLVLIALGVKILVEHIYM